MLTSKAPFIGRDKAGLVRERLLPLAFNGRRSPRHNDPILDLDGRTIGRITSASFAPSLERAIALGYIQAAQADKQGFLVKSRRAELPATRTSLPFYEGTARVKL
jgi:aminomethyltransferase